jgi:hypothetical protein
VFRSVIGLNQGNNSYEESENKIYLRALHICKERKDCSYSPCNDLIDCGQIWAETCRKCRCKQIQ